MTAVACDSLAALREAVAAAHREMAAADAHCYHAHRAYLQARGPDTRRVYRAARARCAQAVKAAVVAAGAADRALSEERRRRDGRGHDA